MFRIYRKDKYVAKGVLLRVAKGERELFFKFITNKRTEWIDLDDSEMNYKIYLDDINGRANLAGLYSNRTLKFENAEPMDHSSSQCLVEDITGLDKNIDEKFTQDIKKAGQEAQNFKCSKTDEDIKPGQEYL